MYGRQIETPVSMHEKGLIQCVYHVEVKIAMSEEHSKFVDSYFEQFLPKVIGRSIFADLNNLSIVVEFFITDGAHAWTLTLERGQLVRIEKGASPLHEVSYDLDTHTLLQVVSGVLSPQKAFFLGKAKIKGDKLKGLKLAMIFDRFIKEYPYKFRDLGTLQ